MTSPRAALAALAIAVGLALLPVGAASADLDDDLAEVLGQIEDLERRLEDAAAERSGIVADVLATRDRLEEAAGRLAAAEAELRTVRIALTGTEVELAATQESLARSYEAIAETRRSIEVNRSQAQDWVRQQYMRRAEGDVAAAIVSAEHVADLGRIVYLLDVVARRSAAAMDRHEALGEEEERQQARIAEREAELLDIRETLAAAEAQQADLTNQAATLAATVESELVTQQELLAALDDLIDHFETELVGLDAEQERLEELLQGVGGGGSSPAVLARPVPGPITSPFGPRHHPILGYVRMHTGVDMTAPHGQDIKAGAAGTVVIADTYGGYGLTVIIDHGGGMTTLYAHQSRLFVSRGDTVTAGEVVGESGSTGLATGPHLHFEVRLDGTPVDPADYL